MAVVATHVLAVQPVEPLNPEAQQEVQVLRPQSAQSVNEVDLQSEQSVTPPRPVSPAMRALSTTGKVVLGVTAAAIAIGGALVSLLFL